MLIKKSYSLGLLSLLLSHASMNANLEDLLMPWKWEPQNVMYATSLLTFAQYVNQDNQTHRELSAIRAAILTCQIPRLLNRRNHEWGMHDHIERKLTATAFGAEALRSFYAMYIRR